MPLPLNTCLFIFLFGILSKSISGPSVGVAQHGMSLEHNAARDKKKMALWQQYLVDMRFQRLIKHDSNLMVYDRFAKLALVISAFFEN